jgi:hypothetical protein
LVEITIGIICFVFDIILSTVNIVVSWTLTSILPSLSLIDVTYRSPDTEATPARRRRFLG